MVKVVAYQVEHTGAKEEAERLMAKMEALPPWAKWRILCALLADTDSVAPNLTYGVIQRLSKWLPSEKKEESE